MGSHHYQATRTTASNPPLIVLLLMQLKPPFRFLANRYICVVDLYGDHRPKAFFKVLIPSSYIEAIFFNPSISHNICLFQSYLISPVLTR